MSRKRLRQWFDKRAEAHREGFGGHSQSQCNDPRRKKLVRAGEGHTVVLKKGLDYRKGDALVAIDECMIPGDRLSKPRRLRNRVCTLVHGVIARTGEGGFKKIVSC